MKKPRSNSRSNLPKMAGTVSAAALMLGVSHAATVGFNFQANYCSAASYSARCYRPGVWRQPQRVGKFDPNGQRLRFLLRPVGLHFERNH